MTGDDLRQARRELRLSARVFAALAGYSMQHVYDLERGRKAITPRAEQRLHNALAVAASRQAAAAHKETTG